MSSSRTFVIIGWFGHWGRVDCGLPRPEVSASGWEDLREAVAAGWAEKPSAALVGPETGSPLRVMDETSFHRAMETSPASEAVHVALLTAACPGRALALPRAVLPDGSRERGPSDEWDMLDDVAISHGGTGAGAGAGAGGAGAAVASAGPKADPVPYRSTLRLTVNGVEYSVTNPDPDTRLVGYVRDTLHLKGTKVGCMEGGCGACTVVVSMTDAVTGDVTHRPINACLHPLCACDGATITTVEGIGSQRAGFHPIQSRLAAGNGSQCGYCSPGWVMSMYGLLQEEPAPTAEQVERHFDGNLCRCTGYRPILEAFKTFASDTAEESRRGGEGTVGAEGEEVEERKSGGGEEERKTGGCGGEGRKKKGGCGGGCVGCPGKRGHGTGHSHGGHGGHGHGGSDALVCDVEDLLGPLDVSKFPPAPAPRATASPDPLHFGPASDGSEWYRPVTLDQLLALKRQYAGTAVQLVGGNTACGVTKYLDPPAAPAQVMIDVSAVPELHTVAASATGVTFGACCSLNDLVRVLAAQPAPGVAYTAVVQHLQHVANNQVRNAGTWAGNLMLSRAYPGFPSDVALALATAGATLTLYDLSSGSLVDGVTVESLLGMPGAPPSPLAGLTNDQIVLVTVTVPLEASGVQARARSYKLMQRHENSHALVNAGFYFTLASAGSMAGNTSPTVASARIVVGAVAKRLFRASKTEAYLAGRALDRDTLAQALTLILQDVDAVGDSTAWGSTAYRRSALQSVLYKTVLWMQPSGSLAPTLQSAATPYQRGLSSGKQTYAGDPSEYPVSQFITKLRAPLQASGEAVYTGDVREPEGMLYGAVVGATVPLGTLTGIDASAAKALPGVVDVVTAPDIPGSNDIGAFPGDEPLLVAVGSQVTYRGQPVALVVATSTGAAFAGAAAVSATYGPPSGGAKAILTLQDAIAAKAFIPPTGAAAYISSITAGDASKAFGTAAHVYEGTVSTGGQKHFYMETQIAVAMPGADMTTRVLVSTQDPTGMQAKLAAVLARPLHRVTVEMTRAGGAFGGKISRCGPVAGMAAVAAEKVGRPVKVLLDRKADMEVTGGREPIVFKYKVGVDASGKVVALTMDMYGDSGSTVDNSPGDLSMAMLWADNCYWLPNYAGTMTMCRTNTPTTTSMRAPGAVQSIFAIECVMERIARELGVPPSQVREANFVQVGQTTPFGQPIKYSSLATVWSQLKESAGLAALQADCADFNSKNRWRKRGVSMTPCKYGIAWGGLHSAASVVVFAGDGTVQVTHGGCEIGQGINTKVAQAVAFTLGVPLDQVIVCATSTDKVPNNTATGGSSTSENSAQAAILACQELNQRLAPIRKAMPGKEWKDIVAAAAGKGIGLATTGWFAPPAGADLSSTFEYFTWGAACSQVEVDCLTGDVQVLKSHVLFDCGVSLDPAVDIGQVEGAFMQGLGYFTSEQVLVASDGKLETGGTWDYKPPGAWDIPLDLQVDLLKDAPNPVGILRSKASGEPPYALANTVFFAIRDAVAAVRSDSGLSADFELPQPATPAAIQVACGVAPTQLTF